MRQQSFFRNENSSCLIIVTFEKVIIQFGCFANMTTWAYYVIIRLMKFNNLLICIKRGSCLMCFNKSRNFMVRLCVDSVRKWVLIVVSMLFVHEYNTVEGTSEKHLTFTDVVIQQKRTLNLSLRQYWYNCDRDRSWSASEQKINIYIDSGICCCCCNLRV